MSSGEEEEEERVEGEVEKVKCERDEEARVGMVNERRQGLETSSERTRKDPTRRA